MPTTIQVKMMDATTLDRNDDARIADVARRDARQFDRQWAAIALLGSAVSLLVSITCYASRLGLSNPPMLFPLCATIVAAALCGALLVPARGRLADVGVRSVALPLATLAIFLSVVLGLWLGRLGIILYAALAAFGVFRAVALTWGAQRRLGFLVLALGLAAYLFIVVHNLGYAGILTPEQSLLGLLNHDTRIHAAIAFLIENFGKPSIGVDGLLPLKYHFGSHYWMAGLSRMAGADPASSYGAAVPSVAAPMLIIAALLSSLAVDRGQKPVTHYVMIGLALLFLADSIDIKSYYISESYTFALIALLLLLPLLAALARGDTSPLSTNLGLAIAILAIPVVCSLKVSVGILWTGGLGWISLRRFGFTLKTVVVGVGCLAALLLALSLFAPGPNDYQRASNALIIPFYYLRLDPQLGSVASLLFPACLILLRLRDQTTLGAVIARRSDLLLEATIVVAAAGALPAMLGIPQDSSVWYFLNVGQWFAISLLPGSITQDDIAAVHRAGRSQRLFAPMLAVLAFVAAAQLARLMTPTFFSAVSDIVRAADQQSGGTLLHGRSVSRYMVDTFKSDRVLFGADFQAALANSPGSLLIRAVRGAPHSDRRDFAVFVPPTNIAYWRFQSLCRDKHNIQAALTGHVSLLGGPPASYDCPRDAYTTPYGSDFSAKDINDQDLCRHADERGIQHVLILNDLAASEKNRMLECVM